MISAHLTKRRVHAKDEARGGSAWLGWAQDWGVGRGGDCERAQQCGAGVARPDPGLAGPDWSVPVALAALASLASSILCLERPASAGPGDGPRLGHAARLASLGFAAMPGAWLIGTQWYHKVVMRKPRRGYGLCRPHLLNVEFVHQNSFEGFSYEACMLSKSLQKRDYFRLNSK